MILRRFSILLIASLLLTGCSVIGSGKSAKEFLSQGCSAWNKFSAENEQKKTAIVLFRQATELDEKYRILLQSAIAADSFLGLFLSSLDDDEEVRRSYAIKSLEYTSVVRSYCD